MVDSRRQPLCALALAFVWLTACTPWASTEGVRVADDVTASLTVAPATIEARGVTLGLYFQDPERSYRSYLWEAANAGADSVSIVWAWGQADIRGVPEPRPGLTPSDAELRRVMADAHALGLRVFLLPILQLDTVEPGEWRGTLAPSDEAAWWAAYSAFIRHAAELAEEGGAAWLSVGSELGSMEAREGEWRNLIEEVRGLTDTSLTYSANWDHYHRTPFWDALDAIGVTGYYELTRVDEHRPTAAELASAWATIRADLEGFARPLERRLILTEVGYVSQRGAARHPWNYTRGLPVDLLAQYDLYAALAAAWSGSAALEGVYLWNWFGDGGSFDDGYTPRQKPAMHVVRRWFGARQGD